MKEKFLGILASLFIRILGFTYRYQFHFEQEADRQKLKRLIFSKRPDLENKAVIAFFHQDELCLLPRFNGQKLALLISQSKDGSIMSEVVRRLGHIPVRGSSSRGAVAGLIACIRKMKEGHSAAIAVDGPRGPIYEVKEGVVALSNKSSSPIIPLRAAPSHFFTFKNAWNQAKLAYPFTRVRIEVGAIASYSAIELQEKLKSLSDQTSR